MHTDSICLYDAHFRVGKKGREKVLKEKRKNVHAGVTGYIDRDWDLQRIPPKNFRSVIYNPYKFKTFVTAEDWDFDDLNVITKPIFSARKVIIGKEVWALVPTKKTLEEN